ncbi:hypothetical protein ICJ04_16765 [Stenotrophomonas sp. 169]|uniref:hypothetical protein n=1 Tax=unclassified Stenotrophomonas TaxID=196198 RepID=UPI00166234A1|nr:hypothetical protein [Stenotrophomonas sp. 169]QNR97109.1 hypothetical protein ICJ04_16765 [Stenotrophomonas sp. 169]
MIRPLILLCLACAPSLVMAQSAAGATGPQSATGLNLAVPSEPLRYLNDPSFQQDAPGTYYGDKSGPLPRGEDGRVAEVTDDKLRVSGSVSTGIGYSEGYGNSHYNAASLNLSKNYTTDEGKTRGVNVNIHVSEGKGPGFYGPWGGGYGGDFGPGPGYWDRPPPFGW